MAKSNRKDQTHWGRFRRWAEENQKVVMVVLLLLIAPLFAFTTPVVQQFQSGGGAVVETVYGRKVTDLDIQATNERLGRVASVIARADTLAGFGGSPFQTVLGLFPTDEDSGRKPSLMGLDGMRYPIYREKALREGLRVSDQELGEFIRELWQWLHAGELAGKEVAEKEAGKKDSPQEFQMQYFQILQLAKEKKDQMDPGEFDPASWAEVVGSAGRGQRRTIRLEDFEETIRDLILIAKLEDQVKTWVQVTPEEAYEEYRNQKQTRLFSWTELALNDALKEKVEKGITPEAVKDYYAANQHGTLRVRSPFHRPASLKIEWLLLPKGHFEEEARKKVTDVELKDYYDKNRNDFRKPAILSTEAQFAPRTAAQSKEQEESLYKPFTEVRDQVLEKVVTQNSRTEMESFASQLRLRLYPAKPATGEAVRPATFAEIVKDHPFLKTGATGFVSRDEAKAALGDAYAAQATSWFTQLDSARGGARPELEPRQDGYVVDAGKVFYRKPETRQAGVPSLKDIESDVRSRLVKEKALKLLEKSATGAVDEINAGKTDLDKVAASGLDVPVPASATGSPSDPAPGSPSDPAPGSPSNTAPAPAENVHVAASPVATSKRHLGRRESLMVPKKEEPKADEKAGEKKPEGEPETPSEEAHPSSQEILDGVFKVAEERKAAAATDLERGSAYIVRHDGVVYPDASGFEAARESMERHILSPPPGEGQGRLEIRFNDWRRQVFAEATGQPPREAATDGKEPAVPTP